MRSNINTLLITSNLEKKVFSSHEMATVLDYGGDEKNINIWIKRLKDRGLVKQIKRGYYSLTREKLSHFEYSNVLYTPSYISLDSALNYYGILPQVPLSVTAVSLKRAKVIEHEGVVYEYAHMSARYFFGYENVGHVLMADREKALVDKVYYESFKSNSSASFMDEINVEEISKEKLMEYVTKIRNTAFHKLMESVYAKF